MKKELPDGWKEYRIREIGTVVTGNTPPKKEPENYGGSLPWIKPPDLDKEMYVSNSEETISDIGMKNVRLLTQGSVLVSCIGNIGKVAIADSELCTNQQINTIVPNKKIVNTLFLYYSIKRIRPYLESIASSAVVPLLNKTNFSNINIELPPLEIQHKIVAILEKAEDTKKLRAQADELTQQLLQSVFLEIFGDPFNNSKNWDLKSAMEFCSTEKNAIKAGPFGSSLKKEFYVESGYKIYGQEQVIANDLSFGDYYISPEKYKKLENYRIQEGDILISLVGSYGKISIVPNEFELGIINPRLMKITLNQEIILPVYFKHLFLSKGMMTQTKILSHGGTMDIINVGIVKDLLFPVPPISLQQKFAEIVEQLEETKQLQQQSSQKITILFDALVQKAFTGDLIH